MAIDYQNTPLLSKVKVGNTVYYLKDAEGRANLEALLGTHAVAALSEAAWREISDVVGNNDKLVTGSQVMDYVESVVETIPSFDVVVVPVGQDLPTASADTFHKIYLTADSPAAGSYIEWITIRSGSEGAYTYSWEQIGSTAIDLSGYVTDITYAAGRKLQQKKDAGYVDIHQFGELADKSAGSVTIDAVTVSGLEAKGQSAGSITVTIKDASAATEVTLVGDKDYTPSGSITATINVGGDVTVAADNDGAFQPAGTIGAQSLSLTPTMATVVGSVVSAGSVPSFANNVIGTYTAPTFTLAESDSFAKAGLTATIGSGADAECLIFTASDTGKASVISNWNGGSWVPGTFNAGSMPTFDTASVMSGVNGAVSQATFTGNKYNLSFSQSGIQLQNPGFTGNAAVGLIPTKAAYYKQEIDTAAFTPAAITLNVDDVVVAGQTKSVSFT